MNEWVNEWMNEWMNKLEVVSTGSDILVPTSIAIYLLIIYDCICDLRTSKPDNIIIMDLDWIWMQYQGVVLLIAIWTESGVEGWQRWEAIVSRIHCTWAANHFPCPLLADRCPIQLDGVIGYHRNGGHHAFIEF